MSYLGHKSRVFRDAGDPPLVLPKRSEGRIKTYPSSTDARAWCVDTEDRRQHILELIRADHDKTALGKYVPIEVLIDTLLANKNADIERLRQQVEELQRLLDMYSKLDLTEDQKRMLAGMQREMDKAGDQLEDIAERSSIRTRSPRESGAELAEEMAEEAEESETYTTEEIEIEVTTTEEEGVPGQTSEKRSTCSAMSRSVCSAASRRKQQSTGGSGATASARGSGVGSVRGSGITGGIVSGIATIPEEYDESDLKSVVIRKDAEIIALKNTLAAKEAECEQQNNIARSAIEQLETLKYIMEERDSLREQLEESRHEIATLRSRIEDPCVGEIAALEQEIDRLRQNGQLSPDDETEIIRKEIEVLKKYCAKLSSIQEENGKLKTQVERIHELSGIPRGYEDEEEDTNDPAELKSRLKELKRKFAKLTEIMDERDKLKLRAQQLETELLKYGDLPEEMETFRRRSQMLDDVMDERDNLHKRLQNMIGLEEELKILKKKADRVDELERQLDAVSGEVGNIRRSSAIEVQNLKSMKDEASRETESIKAERDMLRMKAADMATVEEELERLRYRAKEAEVLRIERDRLKVRLDELAAIECEYMQLLDKTKCFETIKAEKEMYKCKYEELLGLECECDMLRAQVEHFKQLDQERDALLRQVRDCQCCIADQEDEIKKLVSHIDRLSQGSNQQQDRMQKALCDMRAELEKKTSLIATSEEQLAGVQDELKSTIAGVSCETSCLRARVEELENELGDVRERLKRRENELAALKGSLKEKDSLIHSLHDERRSSVELKQALSGKDELIASKDKIIADMQRELEEEKAQSKPGSFDGDEHLERMLRQSKCAVKRVAEELGKHYEEWDCMQDRVFEKDEDDLFAKYSQEKRTSLKLSDDVEELKARIRQLEAELAKANETIAKLREELAGGDRMEAENTALRRHSTEVQEVAKEQIEELVDHLKKANERIAELEAEIAAMRSGEAPDLSQKVADLEAEKRKLESLLQQLQSDQTGDAADVTALRMQLADLQEQLEKETKLRQAAEDQLKDSEGRIANLNKELNSMTDSVLQNSRRSSVAESEWQAELLRLRAENEQLKENMKAADQSASRRTSLVEGEMGVIAEQNKQLLKEKIALESENASLNQQLEDMRRQMNEMLENMGLPVPTSEISPADLERERKEKEDLQNMIKELQGQISAMGEGAEPSSLQDTIAQLNARIAQLQSENETLAAAAAGDDSALLNEVAQLKGRIKELEAENGELNGRLHSLQSEIGGLRRASEEIAEDHASEIKRISKSFEDKIRVSSESLKALEDTMQLSAEDQIALQKLKDKYESQIMDLQRQLDQQKSECQETIAALKSQHNFEMKNLNNRYSDGIAKLQGSHEDVLKDINEVYENEVESLRSELRSSKETIESLLKSRGTMERSTVGTIGTVDRSTIGTIDQSTIGTLDQSTMSALERSTISTVDKSILSAVQSKTISGGRIGRSALSVKTVEAVDIKPASQVSAATLTRPTERRGICTCGTGLETVLKKILQCGLESLTLDELHFLHTKICDARAAALEREGLSPPETGTLQYMPQSSRPSLPSPTIDYPASALDTSLSKRIVGMENNLIEKQRNAQQKVEGLQMAVRMERDKLEELKRCLEIEKQRNCELMCKIGAQSRTVANLQMERDAMRKRSSVHDQELQKVMASCKNLERNLCKERGCVKHLKDALDNEKIKQKRDSDNLKDMRLKLERSLNSEMKLKMELDQQIRGQPPPTKCPCVQTPCEPPQSQTTSFYTELTVQDVRKKRNFVHHCCMKHRGRPGERSSSAQPSSRRTSEEMDE